MLLKCCIQYVSKTGKLGSSQRTGKCQFSFQSQRRIMPKNVQTTEQLCSFLMLVRLCSKSFKLGFSSYVNWKLPDVQTGFRKGKRTRDQIANLRWILEKAREFQKNLYFSSIDYPKAFDCVDQNILWKILKEMEIPDHLTCLPGKVYAGKEATVSTLHTPTDWFKIG